MWTSTSTGLVRNVFQRLDTIISLYVQKFDTHSTLDQMVGLAICWLSALVNWLSLDFQHLRISYLNFNHLWIGALLAFIAFGLAILTFTTCQLAISWLSPLVDPAIITNFKYLMYCKSVEGLVLVWFWIVEILNLVINSVPCPFYSTFPSTSFKNPHLPLFNAMKSCSSHFTLHTKRIFCHIRAWL
jgi:hypothetical protein